MNNQEVTVVYKWTAKEGKSEELKAIYKSVEKAMHQNEPGAISMKCYFDESNHSLVVVDVFQDAQSVGFHLGTTAGAHFQSLLEIAFPGEFIFMGEIPSQMKESAIQMGLQATFAPYQFGFERN